jgi:hypothetical protein
MNNQKSIDQARSNIETKINFLQNQLEELDGNYHLPETYDFLVKELDYQSFLLKRIEVKDRFSKIDDDL